AATRRQAASGPGGPAARRRWRRRACAACSNPYLLANCARIHRPAQATAVTGTRLSHMGRARLLGLLLPPCGGESRFGRGAAETFGPAREGCSPPAELRLCLSLPWICKGGLANAKPRKSFLPRKGGRKTWGDF